MGSPKTRRINESPIYQGIYELITYELLVTPWGSSPSSPSLKILERDQTSGSWTDWTATIAPGSCSVNGDVITFPTVGYGKEGHTYTFLPAFVVNSNTETPISDLIFTM